jgi:hypothetical protein
MVAMLSIGFPAETPSSRRTPVGEFAVGAVKTSEATGGAGTPWVGSDLAALVLGPTSILERSMPSGMGWSG